MDRSLFTPQALKWTLRIFALLFVVIAGLVGAIAMVDANHFRGPLAHFIAARTGREIRIEGSLTAQLISLTPRLIAERVAIGNPPWMAPGPTAEVGRLSLSFELLPLFTHSFVIDRLETQTTTLHLARDSDGRANWQMHDPRERVGTGPPLIHSLLMPKTHVELDDARRHLKFSGTISASDVPGVAATQPLRIEGAGNLNGHATTFVIDGDSLATVKRGQAYRFTFDERSSGSQLTGRGFLPRPFDFHALDTTFEAQGEDLKDLYYLTGVSLPDTGAYRLSGRLAREGMHFKFSDLLATSGQSDMHGTLSIDISSGRPTLDADLHSQLLRLADLGARAAGRAAPTAATPMLLPDTALALSGIRRTDARVNFNANAVQAGPVTVHALAAHATIDQGVLVLTALRATFPDGRLNGRLKFDATGTVPKGDLDLRISDLRLSQFDRKGKGEPPFEGVLQARLTVAGHGSSLHELGSSANGTVSAVLPHGAIRASFAELTGIDVSRALGLMLRRDRKETPVRCGVASFSIHDGTLTEQTLVVDTDSVLITGKGTVQLDSEALDLAIRGQPKSWRLVRLRSPVLVRGTLAHPSIGIDARNSVLQAGEAVALGILLTPLAAVLAFVDPGLAKDADCAALISAAKTNADRGNIDARAH
jgi:AsmA family protein